jgi:hypothetical protein
MVVEFSVCISEDPSNARGSFQQVSNQWHVNLVIFRWTEFEVGWLE